MVWSPQTFTSYVAASKNRHSKNPNPITPASTVQTIERAGKTTTSSLPPPPAHKAKTDCSSPPAPGGADPQDRHPSRDRDDNLPLAAPPAPAALPRLPAASRRRLLARNTTDAVALAPGGGGRRLVPHGPAGGAGRGGGSHRRRDLGERLMLGLAGERRRLGLGGGRGVPRRIFGGRADPAGWGAAAGVALARGAVLPVELTTRRVRGRGGRDEKREGQALSDK